MNKLLPLLLFVPLAAFGAAGDIPVEQADGTFASQSVGGDASLAADGALTVSGGDADTAGALAANGANCSSGNAPLGVDAAGASENCFDVWTEAENTAAGYISAEVNDLSSAVTWATIPDSFVPNDITIDLAATATALAANGGNCSSGNAPLGVDASGAVESCFDVWTEAENAAAAYLSAGSSPTVTGDWTFTGDFNVGDPGLESGSIQLNGAPYTAVTKINDFGSAIDAELVLHRHSTSDANQLVLVRSHSNDSSHGDVIDTDDIGEIMFGGWNTSSYYLGARIRARVDGTPGVGDMPTSMLFQVAADGTANPTTALTISPDKTATFAGDISGNNLSGTNSGDQTITLTGDVTGSGTGSFAATIADSVTVTGWALGASTATTPSADDNDTSVATTAYVQGEINGAGGTNISCASGSCSVTPSGSDTQIQYNNSGVLGAASTFTYDDSAYTFKLGYDVSNYCTWVSAADGGLNLSCLGTDADFNIDLTGATDGDFSVNTNDLFVDTSTGATGLNTTSPNANSQLDVYGKIYQNGVQSLYNPGVSLDGTLVVGDGGGSLSHTSGTEGYYNTFMGIGAGDSVTTQSNMTAIGYAAAYNSSGDNLTATGYSSARYNTGNFVTAYGRESAYSNEGDYLTTNGYSSAQNNTGDSVTVNGFNSAYNNTANSLTASGVYSAQNNTGNFTTVIGASSGRYNVGSYLTAHGVSSARYNTGVNVTSIGSASAQNNTGDYVIASGGSSAQYNSKNNSTAIGYGAYDNWVNGTSYSVTSADSGAETVTVTGHGITIGTYKPLKVGAAGVGGLSNGSVYTFKSVDANTLQPLGVNITSSGTTTLYANSNDFTNVTALGYNAEPTKDNQVMLGDTNVVEVKTSGTVVTPALQTSTALNTATDGGSTPAFTANMAGSTGGPTTAAQNGWLKMKDSTGATIWIPVWK